MIPDAWRHYLLARLWQRLRRTEAAMAAYRTALAADPGFTRAAHGLAYLLGAQQRYAEAERMLRQVLQRSPNDAAAWFNLGFVCDQQHDTDAARAAFAEAVRLDPKLDHAWYGLGLCHSACGDHAAAAAAFERTIQLQPMNWYAWYELGMTHHHLQQTDRVRDVVEHLNRYDRHRARKLIQDTGRSDLLHLVADLRA